MPTILFTLGNSKKIKSKDSDDSIGTMERNIKESIEMTRKMGLGN